MVNEEQGKQDAEIEAKVKGQGFSIGQRVKLKSDGACGDIVGFYGGSGNMILIHFPDKGNISRRSKAEVHSKYHNFTENSAPICAYFPHDLTSIVETNEQKKDRKIEVKLKEIGFKLGDSYYWNTTNSYSNRKMIVVGSLYNVPIFRFADRGKENIIYSTGGTHSTYAADTDEDFCLGRTQCITEAEYLERLVSKNKDFEIEKGLAGLGFELGEVVRWVGDNVALKVVVVGYDKSSERPVVRFLEDDVKVDNIIYTDTSTHSSYTKDSSGKAFISYLCMTEVQYQEKLKKESQVKKDKEIEGGLSALGYKLGQIVHWNQLGCVDSKAIVVGWLSAYPVIRFLEEKAKNPLILYQDKSTTHSKYLTLDCKDFAVGRFLLTEEQYRVFKEEEINKSIVECLKKDGLTLGQKVYLSSGEELIVVGHSKSHPVVRTSTNKSLSKGNQVFGNDFIATSYIDNSKESYLTTKEKLLSEDQFIGLSLKTKKVDTMSEAPLTKTSQELNDERVVQGLKALGHKVGDVVEFSVTPTGGIDTKSPGPDSVTVEGIIAGSNCTNNSLIISFVPSKHIGWPMGSNKNFIHSSYQNEHRWYWNFGSTNGSFKKKEKSSIMNPKIIEDLKKAGLKDSKIQEGLEKLGYKLGDQVEFSVSDKGVVETFGVATKASRIINGTIVGTDGSMLVLSFEDSRLGWTIQQGSSASVEKYIHSYHQDQKNRHLWFSNNNNSFRLKSTDLKPQQQTEKKPLYQNSGLKEPLTSSWKVKPSYSFFLKPSTSKTFSGIKVDFKKAGYRIAARQALKLTHGSIVSTLRKRGTSNEKIKAIVSLLSSEYGKAAVALTLGIALEQYKGKLPASMYNPYELQSSPGVATSLAKEFRIDGLTIAGNEIINTIFSAALEALTAEQVKVRVAEEKDSLLQALEEEAALEESQSRVMVS